MTLLAAFEVLLHQYSGQEDLVLCTPASGRHRSQTKDLIGYFNNILPMRFDLRGDPTFVELVRRTRKVALDAFKYQDLPFQVIADSPNLKAVPLSRVLFSLDIEWPPKLALAGPDVRGVGRSAPRRRISTCPCRCGWRARSCGGCSSTRPSCSTTTRSPG